MQTTHMDSYNSMVLTTAVLIFQLASGNRVSLLVELRICHGLLAEMGWGYMKACFGPVSMYIAHSVSGSMPRDIICN